MKWEFVNKQPKEIVQIANKSLHDMNMKRDVRASVRTKMEEVELEVRALPQLHLQVPQCPQ